MTKKDLYCIKTDNGYGLFQEYDSYPNMFNYIFYVVYYAQIMSLSETEIQQAIKGEYYYSRISFEMWKKGFSKNILLSNPKVEFSARDFGIKDEDPYYGKCSLIYLGQYDLPYSVELPKYSRKLDLSKLSGKYKWNIHNEINNCLERNERGVSISYKKLNDNIKSYPRYFIAHPVEIKKRFNANYRQSEDDKWVERYFEEFYQEYPEYRPSKLKYEEVKYPLPVNELRELSKDIEEEKERKEYERFCDKIEELCLVFLDGIDQDKKAVRKWLKALIDGLNSLNKETGLIDTLEAEIIYEYVSNILKSLKKISLLEYLEEKRDW